MFAYPLKDEQVKQIGAELAARRKQAGETSSA
jgi:hypothetical protein